MQVESYPRFRQAADQAVILEFGDTIDLAINLQVTGLDRELLQNPIPGVLETVPTYRSLCVYYDPSEIRAADLIEKLRQRLPRIISREGGRRLWTVPVFYGGAAESDVEDVARLTQLSTHEVITLHSQAPYRLYMIGFMPGYAYLGGLPEALHTSRLSRPRPSVPRGSIAIGGTQTSILPVESPCGWRVLGNTPLRLFDPAREPSVLLQVGDEIRFHPVRASEAERLEKISEAGGIAATCETLE